MRPVETDAIDAEPEAADRKALLAEREAVDAAGSGSVAHEHAGPVLLAVGMVPAEERQAGLNAPMLPLKVGLTSPLQPCRWLPPNTRAQPALKAPSPDAKTCSPSRS